MLNRMKLCPLRRDWKAGPCSGPIQWHHVWIYAGRQIDEVWAILGICEGHHDMVNGNEYIRHALQRESLLLASQEDLDKYPRKDWKQIKISIGMRI